MEAPTTSTTEATTSEVLVRADEIEKTYGSNLPFTRSVPVLTGANLEIRAGEIVGIVGGNGSGKSTLMNILVGVLKQDSGAVERTGTVGWCPQEPLLYDRLTVTETFRLFGSGYGMTAEEIDEAKRRFASKLDFEQYLDYRIDQLSGGNRQKINLSIALMHDPDVLMLDEPYTGFDWETYLTFWDLADELAADGTAVVMISHLIEEQSRLDRIYEVRDGHVYDVTERESETEATTGERRRKADE
ncbi:ABC transporter ATP-binding protein [Halorubrum amylolyticum]|uniref:ABC transporter ATP-binding protein n=1 Tax=Halorubrum amylolyticum TaxID=2508724 RepID=UPI0013E8EF37|nr:ATP-binding cassette domain-containing protein [Halorubrum amylolyticum]